MEPENIDGGPTSDHILLIRIGFKPFWSEQNAV
jgi:hypothetical protein